jgi:iron complex outermembrane receptor protein
VPQAAVADIVVTAQRRESKLARTPVAVAVLSADTLAQASITTQSDLQIATPGLQVRAGENSNQLNYAIRGQSLDTYSDARPGVLPYFNEVQVGGSGASSFYDLQSVQVLKGPQGTLFGRNATGGAVLFQSQKPTDDFGGYASAAVGTYNAVKFEGALNVPIIADKVLARVSGFYQKRDGFQTNVIDGQHFGNIDRYAFRGSLTIKPVEGVRNDLVVDYQHIGGNSTVAVLRSFDAGGPFPTTSLYSNATFPAGSSPLTGTSVSDYVLSQVLQGLGLPAAPANAIANGNYARYVASHPDVDPAGVASYLATQNARGPYQVASTNPNFYNAKNVVITNSTAIDIGANTQIKNLFGFTSLWSSQTADVDGTPSVILELSEDVGRTRQLSDELQLIGQTFGKKLSYVAGFYYSDETFKEIRVSSSFDIIPISGPQTNHIEQDSTTYAGYAQGTYDLSSFVQGLGFTAGLRYTSETARNILFADDTNYGFASTGLPAVVPPVPASDYSNDQSTTYNNLSYTFGVQDQVNHDLLVYATTRRSYRNGGYNPYLPPRIGTAAIGGDQYITEKVSDVEVGTKFSGRVAGMPGRLNVAAYYDWIKNDQRTAFTIVNGSLSALTVNVPRARVYGAEFDGQLSPSSWLSFGAVANYTNSAFAAGANTVDILGATTTYLYYTDTPKWSGDIYADITIPLSHGIDAFLHGDGYGQTTSQSSAASFVPIAGYALANFRFGIRDDRAGWSLTANLKNAFNHTYYTGGLPLGSLVQINTVVPGDRRTFLVEARYKF